jgi:hypothetical protein
MRKTYTLIQDKLSFTLIDTSSNSTIAAIHMEEGSPYSKAILEMNGTKYNFSTSTFAVELYLDLGEKRVAEIEVEMSGNYIFRILNKDEMTKHFTLVYKSIFGDNFVVKDFLMNELFLIKSNIYGSRVDTEIIEEVGWDEESNNIDKYILLASIAYSMIVYGAYAIKPKE